MKDAEGCGRPLQAAPTFCIAEMKMPELCIAILAGGKSRRMGFNKALIEIDGRPVIQLLSERARRLSDEVIVCSDEAASFGFLGLPVVGDAPPGHGPLGGLHSALLFTRRQLVLLVACDLPRANERLWRDLLSFAADHDAVIPKTSDGLTHPLCALYRRTCLPSIERNISRNNNKVTDIFRGSRLKVRWLEGTEAHFHDSDFDNLNTPEDLSRFTAGPRQQ